MGGGLSELIDRFKQAGQGEVAESWISKGPNQPAAPDQLEKAIPSNVLATLSEHTGLSREELLSRLSRNLPEAIDRYTPDGRLPAATFFVDLWGVTAIATPSVAATKRSRVRSRARERIQLTRRSRSLLCPEAPGRGIWRSP